MADTFYQENLCLNKVASVVSGKNFLCKFVPFTGDVDNGLDGVILWRRKGTIVDTLYVQCKGGDSYLPPLNGRNYESRFKLRLSKEYVKRHYPIWMACSSPVILVVCNSNEKAWWLDLKSPDSYSAEKDELFCEPQHLFKASAKKELDELLKKQTLLSSLPTLTVYGKTLSNCMMKESLKVAGKKYYRELGDMPIPCGIKDFHSKVEFSRVGWMHITRRNRKIGRAMQSILLLPAVPEILKKAEQYRVLYSHTTEISDVEYEKIEKLGIIAQCYFNYRFPCIVKLILLRKKYISPDGEKERIWFYSIYELSRDKKLSDMYIK